MLQKSLLLERLCLILRGGKGLLSHVGEVSPVLPCIGCRFVRDPCTAHNFSSRELALVVPQQKVSRSYFVQQRDQR